jgi:toxin ParE1/3/4
LPRPKAKQVLPLPLFGIAKHPRARRDLIEIWNYTAEHWGEEQADRYVRLINHAIQRLRDNPSIGSDCGHVRPGLRRYPAGAPSHLLQTGWNAD